MYNGKNIDKPVSSSRGNKNHELNKAREVNT